MISDPKMRAELQKEYDMLAQRAKASKLEADQIREGLKQKQAVLNTTESALGNAQTQVQALKAELQQLTHKLNVAKSEVEKQQAALTQVHQETAALAQRLGPVAQKQKRFEEALDMVKQNLSISSAKPAPPVIPQVAPPSPIAPKPPAPPPASATVSSTNVSDSDDADSKRSPRAELEMELSFEIDLGQGSEHNFYTGLTNNISEGGLFISTTQVLDLGTKIKFPLLVPGMSQAEVVEGEVRWVRREGRAEENVPSGIGIQFTQASSTLKKCINTYIRRRESIFYEE